VNGSPDSGPRMEVTLDHDTRMVHINMWRQFDLAPTPIAFPFAVFKEACAEINREEAERERHGFRWTYMPKPGPHLVNDDG
jgi:hypothetical protein